jgi:hypothetical protein
MVYIMITSYYPPHIANEVGKMYLEVRKDSTLKASIAKRIVPVGVASIKGGYKITAVYDVKPGKLEEALLILSNAMLKFGEIEGYTYHMETLLSGAEAMPMLGLEMPED